MTIELEAGSDFNTAGKQYIARIVGRNSKFTFEREFIGRRSGKRNDITTAIIDTPGIYEVRDTDRKGTYNTYYIIAEIENKLTRTWIEVKDAMELAKNPYRTDKEWSAQAIRFRIKDLEEGKTQYSNENPDKKIKLTKNIGQLDKGTEVSAAQIVAEYNRLIQKLQSSLEGEDRQSKIAKVKKFMNELGITLDDLKDES